MLLNLSDHPFAKWDQVQRDTAEQQFGIIVDIPFPSVDPASTLEIIDRVVDEYVQECQNIFAAAKESKPGAVHLMGEHTFTYRFAQKMELLGIVCVASITERNVTENDNGSMNTTIEFVQFRPYFETRKKIRRLTPDLKRLLNAREKSQDK